MQAKNRLDIYRINGVRLGVFREPFDRVGELAGYSVRAVAGNPTCWEFSNPETNEHGRLLDVMGLLCGQHVKLSSNAMAYMVTRQGYTLALLFPGSPRRIRLNLVRFRILKEEKEFAYPEEWPRELIARVIKVRFRQVVIINENFLLSQIGLRD
ncbi:MAG: hypothetical protein HY342_11965 [Candidatus Lambdaproteobacteria bacterium]|nr:hypothetical protein [Candidatus Lambdaproteobacteria bacterium]